MFCHILRFIERSYIYRKTMSILFFNMVYPVLHRNSETLWITTTIFPEFPMSFLNNIFSNIKILSWQLFPCSLLKTWFHCLPISTVSVYKTATNCLSIICLFCLAAFIMFYLSLIFSNFTKLYLIWISFNLSFFSLSGFLNLWLEVYNG